MRPRPVVWLLVLIALSGGWLVYDWRRDAPEEPVAGNAGAPGTVADPPAAARVVGQADRTDDPVAAPSAERAPTAVAPGQQRALGDQIADQAASPVPAPAASGEPPEPSPAVGQEPPAASGDGAVDWQRLGAIAPGTGPASDPVASPAPVELTDQIDAAVETAARTIAPPPGPVGAATDVPRAAETPLAAESAPALIRPSFDIVRVERDGRAVVAGRAAPGAEVELRAGDRVLDRVRASRRGEWVATPVEPLPPGGQELTLAARSADDASLVLSEQVVVIAQPEPPPPQPAPVAAAEPPPPQPAEVAAEMAPGEPVAVLLPGDGEARGRILQAPGRISSDGSLALLVLDYDHAGQVRLSGEGPPGAPVRVYVDNQASAEVVVAPSGQWTTVLGQQLAPGNYSLRLDQLGSEGRPVARLETPFTRVRQPPVAGEAQVDYVIVQPGNSLWRIARRLFGDGFRYVHLYDANQGQIRDPDLIYPGQVFEVPAALGTAG